jgi:hypothetical protein
MVVSPLPLQTRARLRALQARIAEVAAAGGASIFIKKNKNPFFRDFLRVALCMPCIAQIYQ